MSILHTLKFIADHPLNRDARSAAVLRFLQWQFRSRLQSGPVVVPWVGNTKMLVRRSDSGFTQNIYCGLQDLPEMSYVLHVIKAGELFVDIGANVGAYTVLACGAKHARGCCFEPVPSTYARLTDNLALNSLLSRVTAHNVGLADSDGELMFTAEEDCMNHVVQPGEASGKTVTVPVRTLDSVLTGESPALMKIDVEGFEKPVLKGAGSVLGNPSLHSVLMELNGSGRRYGYDDGWIVDHMHSHGFKGFAYDPFARELSPITGKSDATNTIFIRGAERIARRLKDAPPFQIGPHSI